MRAFDSRAASTAFLCRGRCMHSFWQKKWEVCQTAAQFLDTLPTKQLKTVFGRVIGNTGPVRIIREYDLKYRRADVIVVTSTCVCVIEIKTTTTTTTTNSKPSDLQDRVNRRQVEDIVHLMTNKKTTTHHHEVQFSTTLVSYLVYINVKRKRKNKYGLEAVTSPVDISIPIYRPHELRWAALTDRPFLQAVAEVWRMAIMPTGGEKRHCKKMYCARRN